jgi:hypothetical protein
VSIRPADTSGTLCKRSLTVNFPQKLGASFTYGKPTIEFDPELAAQREDAYAWANRLRRRTGDER